jgi:mycothiol synthase
MAASGRKLTADDAPALAAAYAAVEAVDRTEEHFSEQDVREELADGEAIVLFEDGTIVGYARLHGSPERTHLDAAVVPPARGRGLGRRLLAWGEERARELGRDALTVDVHDKNLSKEALVRAAGYEETRRDFRMTRDVDGTLPEPAPGDHVVRFTRNLDEAVRQAHCEAFADHPGAVAPDPQRWAQSHTGMRAFRPDVSWLALDHDEVAGYLLTYFWEADAAANGVREAFIGQLGVRRPWRRRGLGGLLLATALRSYADSGYERAVLTVDTANPTGALRVYERAGFDVRDSSARWIKQLV